MKVSNFKLSLLDFFFQHVFYRCLRFARFLSVTQLDQLQRPWLEYKIGLNQKILSFCQIFGSTDSLWESWCDIGLREGSGYALVQVWSLTITLSGLSHFPPHFDQRHFHIREHFPALLNCLWAADVHYRPSAFSLKLNLAEARPGCCGVKTAWDRDLVSLGGGALGPTVGPSRAALGPTAWQRNTPLAGVLLALELLLPARHAACGGRGNRKRVR